jgi:hypothetical protein
LATSETNYNQVFRWHAWIYESSYCHYYFYKNYTVKNHITHFYF